MATKNKVPVRKSTKNKATKRATKNKPSKKNQPSKPLAVSGPASSGKLLTELHEEITKILERFSSGFPWPWTGMEPLRELGFPSIAASPRVDFSEGDDAYEVTAELPGLDEKDIEVSLSERLLSIRGEKRDERDVEEKDYHLSERSYGAFQRSLSVPEGVDTGKVSATFDKGLLTIHLPKRREAKSKRRTIAVKQGR